MTNTELVRRLWHAIEMREWSACEALCAQDLTYTLPQSGELYRRAGYLRLNKEYPEDWHVSVDLLIDGGDWVVSEVTVTFPDRQDHGVTLFRCANSQIVEIREYWPEPFAIPDWRLAWKADEEEQP